MYKNYEYKIKPAVLTPPFRVRFLHQQIGENNLKLYATVVCYKGGSQQRKVHNKYYSPTANFFGWLFLLYKSLVLPGAGFEWFGHWVLPGILFGGGQTPEGLVAML